jgi:hypothetical protein
LTGEACDVDRRVNVARAWSKRCLGSNAMRQHQPSHHHFAKRQQDTPMDR